MMNQQPTWTVKLSLTELPGRLCPDLQRRHWRAVTIAGRGQSLPPRVVARVAKWAANLMAKETARLVTKECGAINSCPIGAEEFTGEEGAIPPDANLYLDAEVSPGAGAKVMIWYGDSPDRISPERLAEIEGVAQEKAQVEADLQMRAYYKRLADRTKQQINRRILQALGDGSLQFIGWHGDTVEEIPPHLAPLLEIVAQTIQRPPAGDTDPGTVWHDVFVSYLSMPTPNGAKSRKVSVGKPGAGNVPYNDDALVVRAVRGMENHTYRSAHAAAWALVSEIEGGGTELSKVRRLADRIRRAERMAAATA